MPNQQHAAVDMLLWKVKEAFVPEPLVTKMQNVIVKKECENSTKPLHGLLPFIIQSYNVKSQI